MSKIPKAYIGDSVYADNDGYHITLTTENGYGASNTIHMEDQVFLNLCRYIEQMWDIKISISKKLPPNKSPICQTCQEVACECGDE